MFVIPCSILKNRELSVLENISYHLKNNYKLTYHDVAVLLRKNDRTIWTVYQRAVRKLAADNYSGIENLTDDRSDVNLANNKGAK